MSWVDPGPRGDPTLNKPILVTGGAGFIGSHLTDALVRRGETVRVLDDLSSGRKENLESALASGRCALTVGSVRDPGCLRPLLENVGRIYHLAASVGVGVVTAEPLESLENNLESVQVLLNALRELPSAPHVVLFSSSEVYGKSDDLPLREEGDFVFGPSTVLRWSYAGSKVIAEFLALAEHQKHGVPMTIVRCFNTCGPRQLPTYGMVIPRFLEQARAGAPITVYGDGRQTRCFSYVGDVVRGVLELADHPGALGEIFNLGTDQETSVLELAERVRSLTGTASPIRLVPYHEVFGDSFQDVRRRVPDLTKIRRLTGYEPATNLDGILRSILDTPAKVPAPALLGS